MPESMHPRPQLTRSEWTDLQGEWDFSFDDQDIGLREGWWRRFPSAPGKIIVPFPPESPASGIGDHTPHRVVWYHRRVEAPQLRRANTSSFISAHAICDISMV